MLFLIWTAVGALASARHFLIPSGPKEMDAVRVVGECECVAEAVEALCSTQIDLVLLDMQLPDGTGFDVVRQVGPPHMPAVSSARPSRRTLALVRRRDGARRLPRPELVEGSLRELERT